MGHIRLSACWRWPQAVSPQPTPTRLPPPSPQGGGALGHRRDHAVLPREAGGGGPREAWWRGRPQAPPSPPAVQDDPTGRHPPSLRPTPTRWGTALPQGILPCEREGNRPKGGGGGHDAADSVHRLSRIHRVIPAQAGISVWPRARCSRGNRDSRLRGNDAEGEAKAENTQPIVPTHETKTCHRSLGRPYHLRHAPADGAVATNGRRGRLGGRRSRPVAAQAWTTGPTGSITPSCASPGAPLPSSEAASR